MIGQYEMHHLQRPCRDLMTKRLSVNMEEREALKRQIEHLQSKFPLFMVDSLFDSSRVRKQRLIVVFFKLGAVVWMWGPRF